MASSDNSHFKGWLAHDEKSIGNFKYGPFQPKNWTEEDVEIKIYGCGLCASDVHTASGGWGRPNYPLVVGHEIVGRATKVGKNVQGIKEGDMVGVGAQSGSCLECGQCKADKEQYCDRGQTGTYNGKYPDGSPSSGGFADYARVPAHFCIPIPDGVDPLVAAPMMCGGVTVYSPLKFNNVGPGTKVGVVGIGGLGHFAVMFAAAMGAEVTAISHSHSKEEDARKMGASHFVATSDKGAVKQHRRTLDVIICTVNHEGMDMSQYLSLLKVHGRLTMVGAPEKPIPLTVFQLLLNGIAIAGSAIGSPKEIKEMLELAQKANVKSWIQVRPMAEVNQAFNDMEEGKARYRYVLKNDWEL